MTGMTTYDGFTCSPTCARGRDLTENAVITRQTRHAAFSIYGLFDASGALRYIGKANDPAKRLAGHMRDSRRRNTPLYAWIKKHGLPEMRVLEVCDDWREAERRLIAEARARGENLLNLAHGGDQPFCPDEVLSANGRMLNARMKSNPNLARYRECKRQLSAALRSGHLMNTTRQKMREAAALNPRLFGDWAHIPNREEDADGSPVT